MCWPFFRRSTNFCQPRRSNGQHQPSRESSVFFGIIQVLRGFWRAMLESRLQLLQAIEPKQRHIGTMSHMQRHIQNSEMLLVFHGDIRLPLLWQRNDYSKISLFEPILHCPRWRRLPCRRKRLDLHQMQQNIQYNVLQTMRLSILRLSVMCGQHDNRKQEAWSHQ